MALKPQAAVWLAIALASSLFACGSEEKASEEASTLSPASSEVSSTGGSPDHAAPDGAASAQGYLSCSAAFDQLDGLETPEGVANSMDCAYGETQVTLEVSSHPIELDEQLLEAARGKVEPFWVVSGENWTAMGRSSDASEAADFAEEFGGQQR